MVDDYEGYRLLIVSVFLIGVVGWGYLYLFLLGDQR